MACLREYIGPGAVRPVADGFGVALWFRFGRNWLCPGPSLGLEEHSLLKSIHWIDFTGRVAPGRSWVGPGASL